MWKIVESIKQWLGFKTPQVTRSPAHSFATPPAAPGNNGSFTEPFRPTPSIARELPLPASPSAARVQQEFLSTDKLYTTAASEVTSAREVLHEWARYQENGRFHYVHYSELQNDKIYYRLAPRKDLQTADGLFPLFVRRGHTDAVGRWHVSHFVMNGDAGRRYLQRPESDPLHNERIEQLCEALNSRTRLTIQTRLTGERWNSFKKLGETSRYRWGQNEALHFPTGFIRPDITGRSLTQSPSVLAPTVFIEVVNTHYPSEQTWEGYKGYTKTVPSIVLFDFPKTANWSFSVNRSERTIRGIYHMVEGELWKNDRQLTGYTALQFMHYAKAEIERHAPAETQKQPKASPGKRNNGLDSTLG